MSLNPFTADPAVPLRLAKVTEPQAAALCEAARGLMREGVLSAADAAALAGRFGLSGVTDLMLLLLPVARALARPPISQFFVGAVGLEEPGGSLIFGRNVEFPGTHLGFTLHGEGFLATRAFHRGTRLTVIALGEAHPCAHCRQFLSEFAGSADLTLIDPAGHRLTLSQLYPWPFDPAYLGQDGAVAGREAWPTLTAPGMDPALLAAGRAAHAPYSHCPAAVLLTMKDGARVTGRVMESVAFNPTIGPLQAAVVEALARGYDYGDIAAATLGQTKGAVDFAASTAELLSRIAPGASLNVQEWRP